MKKISIFLALLATLFSCSNRQAAVTTGFEGKSLPSFKLLLTDSSTWLDTNSIPTGGPIVLLYFSPYCPYCRAQIQEIADNMQSLKNIRFYLLSNFPFASIKSSYDQFQLKKYPNVIVGQDNGAYFGNYYKATGVPYIAIYNKDKRLKQVLVGKVSVNLIKDIAIE